LVESLKAQRNQSPPGKSFVACATLWVKFSLSLPETAAQGASPDGQVAEKVADSLNRAPRYG
ncbi:MAG: hypothetical protein KBH45_10035, partial [Verrucomicrobia bacterium]|nr:hypothetical protein [Verrucomicrobiota bacterium]